jgi:hypothetical protein
MLKQLYWKAEILQLVCSYFYFASGVSSVHMSGSQGSFTAQWVPTLDDPTLDSTVANYDKSTYTKRD